jgi:hypothetical protein
MKECSMPGTVIFEYDFNTYYCVYVCVCIYVCMYMEVVF